MLYSLTPTHSSSQTITFSIFYSTNTILNFYTTLHYPGEVGAYTGEVGAYTGEVGAYTGEVGACSAEVGTYSGELNRTPFTVATSLFEHGRPPPAAQPPPQYP